MTKSVFKKLVGFGSLRFAAIAMSAFVILAPGSAQAVSRKSIHLIADAARLDDLGPWSPTGYNGPLTEGSSYLSPGIGGELGFLLLSRLELTVGGQYLQRKYQSNGQSFFAHTVQLPVGLSLQLPLGLRVHGGLALHQTLSLSNQSGGTNTSTTPEANGLKPLLERFFYGAGICVPLGSGGKGLSVEGQYFTDGDNASENYPTKRLFRDFQILVGLSFAS